MTLSGDDSATWSGGGTGAYVAYPLFGCENLTPLDACDATLVSVGSGATSLTITMAPGATDDFDMSVYPNADPSADPIEGTTGEAAGVEEKVTIANPSGTYLVEVANFLSLEGAFTATAALDSPDLAGDAGNEQRARESALAAQAAALKTAVRRANF